MSGQYLIMLSWPYAPDSVMSFMRNIEALAPLAVESEWEYSNSSTNVKYVYKTETRTEAEIAVLANALGDPEPPYFWEHLVERINAEFVNATVIGKATRETDTITLEFAEVFENLSEVFEILSTPSLGGTIPQKQGGGRLGG